MSRWAPTSGAAFMGILLAFGAGRTDAAPPVSRTFVPGDLVKGAVDFAGDVDDVWFVALQKTKIAVKAKPVRGPAGTKPWAPLLELLHEDGSPVQAGRKAAKGALAQTTPVTGAYRIRVSAPPGRTGAWELKTAASFSKDAKSRTAKFGPASATPLPVQLLPGARLALTATQRNGAPPFTLELAEPDGRTTDLMGGVVPDARGRYVIPPWVAGVVGRHLLEVGVTGVAKDAVTVRVVVTQPKGAATLDLSESILGSEWDPVVVPATYRLATDLVVASAAQPVGVATAFATGAVGSGVTLDSLRPDLTQISFLTAGDGTPFAPFVVRPADAVQPDVVIGAARVASGVVGLHPFLTRLDDGDRETFFDLVAASPGFPFLVAAVSDALKYDPAGLSDPAKFPEVFTAADKAVRETLAVLQYALPKLDVVTDCGTFPVGAGLSIAAASDSRVAFVNPRHVFFGVETSGAEFATRAFLVPPRRGVLKVFPPGGADPGTECVLLRPGRNDFAADALAPGADWLSAGGRGTLANALYGVLQTVSLTVRVPLPVTTSDVVEVLIDDLVLSADTPGNDEFATGLTGIVGSGLTPDLWFQQLAGWLTEDGGTRWDELAHRIWQHWPGDGPVAVHAAGARFLRSFTLVLAVNDAAPFVYDVVRSVNEAPVTFCATATGGTPTIDCDAEPFSFEPGFTALPVFAAIGETVTFDPSSSTFSVTPPALPQYTWTISDGAGAAPTVIANSSSSSAVAFQFTAPGFHNVVLDLAVGPSTQRVVRPVQIDVFQNLGFELGDGTHWTTESHTWDNPTPDSRPQHSLVVTPGADEIAPALNRVFRGSYSLRIEDSGSNAFISTASRTVRVPAGGAVVRFAWAAVLQDPAHLPHEQPYFDVHVTDLTTGDTLYSIHHYAGEAGFPWSDAPVLGWKYVPWQPVTLDLSTLGGHDVRISAIGADCSLGGHGGYVYLDAP